MKRSIVLQAGLSVLLTTMASVVYAQSDVQALADQWMQAYNQHDEAAIGAVYAEDARLMLHGSPTVVGRDSVEAFWAADFEEGNPLTLMDVTHSVVGSDMMLVHGDYRVIDRDDGGQLGFGRFAHIWTRDGNAEWLLDRDLWNQPYEPYDPSTAENDVQALADRWTQAYNQYDRAALASVYTDDARLMMHGAPTIVGRDDIEAFWAEDFEEDNPLTLLTTTHAVHGLDMILVHGDYEVVNRGDGVPLGFGRFAHIWTRDGTEWRLDRDLWQQRFEEYEATSSR